MNQNKPPQGQQINIELGEKEAEGIYSNLAIITHSPAEFIIDFTRIVPGVPKAKVHARIITTPQHAKIKTCINSKNSYRVPDSKKNRDIGANAPNKMLVMAMPVNNTIVI